MILIDGVKYVEWAPKNEDEFEQIVNEHALEIFGENSLYFDRKLKLQSLSGIGSIPDGYAIALGSKPQWHIVEVELSSHPLYNHIVPQISRFINGIKNLSAQKTITDEIYHSVIADDLFNVKMDKVVQTGEIYKFIADLVSDTPVITIVIEKNTPELEEALDSFGYSKKNIVEFRTFNREGAETVHAHLFESLYTASNISPSLPIHTTEKAQKIEPHHGELTKAGKVTFEELISAGLVKDGQVLCFYNTKQFKDERAQIIASSNQLKYEVDGRIYSKSELAKILLIKHGFKHDEHGVAGPKYWVTEEGKSLRDLDEQVRIQRGDRK